MLSISHSIGNNLLTGFSRDVFAFLQPHTERERNGTEQATVFLLVASVSRRRRRRCRRYTCRSLSPFALLCFVSLLRSFSSLRTLVCMCVCVLAGPGRGRTSCRLGCPFGFRYSFQLHALHARAKKGQKRRAPIRQPPKIHKMYSVFVSS